MWVLLAFALLTQAQSELVWGDDPSKPTEVNQELLCESCHAIMHQIAKKLPPNFSEADVFDITSAICEQPMRIYKFIPPRMKDGCAAFLARSGDDFEDLLLDFLRTDRNSAEDLMCASVCKGVSYVPPKQLQEPKPERPGKTAKKKPKKRRQVEL
eukprot:c12585_g1_i1.p1 GENE.c12585_g1_i1~~c12585_g1_i1.p1  ORF type:complete len:155 (-),score=27.10 c12585_g1_i1:286-750(-)